MEITAKLGELEEHFPLGGFENAVQIENTAAGHFCSKRENTLIPIALSRLRVMQR